MSIHTLIFSERLKDFRKKAGMTQAELAKKAGLNSCVISFYEIGTRAPSLDNFMKICMALRIYPNELSCIKYEKITS